MYLAEMSVLCNNLCKSATTGRSKHWGGGIFMTERTFDSDSRKEKKNEKMES